MHFSKNVALHGTPYYGQFEMACIENAFKFEA